MSEYQYYEFAAIDRPLTPTEMDELRAVSSRAAITPIGFSNHYEWGDLKANPDAWMRRYFDAFVYSAHWCSCRLSLRLPRAVFQAAELQPFANGTTLVMDATENGWVLNWSLDESEDYERFAQDDGSGWMRRLLPLRDELLRGDARPLYLGWLAGVYAQSDDDLEPEVPPGLAALSPAQQALAEFLQVDPDLLAAAQAGSAPLAADEAPQLDAWLQTWGADDMRQVLKNLVLDQGASTVRQLTARYAAWLKAQRPCVASGGQRRSVATLHTLAQAASSVRQEREAQERARQHAERQRQREAVLRQLMADPAQLWQRADAQAARGVAAGYDGAERILTDLAEGYALTASRAAFEHELRRFLAPHAKRTALRRRLSKAGLWLE